MSPEMDICQEEFGGFIRKGTRMRRVGRVAKCRSASISAENCGFRLSFFFFRKAASWIVVVAAASPGGFG